MKWLRDITLLAWRRLCVFLRRDNPASAGARLPGNMTCRLHLPEPLPVVIHPSLLAQLTPDQVEKAQQAAAQASASVDGQLTSGVWFHPLAEAAKSGAVIQAVLSQEQPSRPTRLALLRLFPR